MQNFKPLLILARHGQSVWNKENRFTGWVDVGLTFAGMEECRKIAEYLGDIPIHIAYTSQLKRAWKSLKIILDILDLKISVERTVALNERHYGILQGMNKDDARRFFGEQQVNDWRRGFHDRPIGGESLFDTYSRTIPFFKSRVVENLLKGLNVLIVAHGNSLRAIIKHIENLDDEEVMNLEIPFGIPIFYHFKNGQLIKSQA